MGIRSFFAPVDRTPEETRVSILPAQVKKLADLGAEVVIERGLGARLGVPDQAYVDAGATLVSEWDEGLNQADGILALNPPDRDSLLKMDQTKILISYLHPFQHPDVVDSLCQAKAKALCMELIPRTTLAQKMDALSSQASLAGYAAVILAAEKLDRVFPMMMTPAGTLSPARVLIIGAGVAGLQAIATAKRLGARVEAYDTRPQVATEITSLGAKFIDLGVSGEQTDQGYAKALTDDQIAAQRAALAKHCAQADIIITTAAVFGRKAPVIITEEMVDGMSPGSIIIDGAAETGGNVACSSPGEEVERNGVRVIALKNLAGRVPVNASDMYSSNLCHLITHFWNKETKEMRLDESDEIMAGCLAVKDGRITSDRLKHLLGKA
ncbi:MAG: NAD(P) transhydrogenase subunit alpha [Lentisphaeria bacterium]|nr:NAD(P) transhydrogenase subunit alpha [Lentisphaeria bacterium]